jgi:hypothetical protein
MLAGCLTSNEPLFTQTNARATPLAAGIYEVCQIEKSGPPSECNEVAVAIDGAGLYTFQVDEPGEGPTYGRFKAGAGRGAWAAQLWSPSDGSPFYFLAWEEGDDFAMSLIECDALPAGWKNRYAAKGMLEVSGTACTVSSAKAVISAAIEYRKTNPAVNGDRLVYKRKAG